MKKDHTKKAKPSNLYEGKCYPKKMRVMTCEIKGHKTNRYRS